MKISDKCFEGNHNLIPIFSAPKWQGQEVVRWCQDCGAVVVDFDMDAVTYAGKFMPMKLPAIVSKEKEAKRQSIKIPL